MKAGDPESYRVVDSLGGFDLPTYEAMGLNLSRLEDPSEAGLVFQLRTAAVRYTLADPAPRPKSRIAKSLAKAQGNVWAEMNSALGGLITNLGGVTIDHPAIEDFALRHPRALESSPSGGRRLDHIFRCIRFVGLDLVRPTGPQDESDRQFTRIALPGLNFYDESHPGQVADQLAQAHVELRFD